MMPAFYTKRIVHTSVWPMGFAAIPKEKWQFISSCLPPASNVFCYGTRFSPLPEASVLACCQVCASILMASQARLTLAGAALHGAL